MKPPEDKLVQSKELNEQIIELKRKKNRLKNETKRKASWEQRKLRTKRLIETGALAEKYFGLEEFSLEQREKIFQTFSDFVKGKIKNVRH